MKYIYIILLAAVAFSCRPVRKIQTIKTAINKKDTTQPIVVKANPVVDSMAIAKTFLQHINHINFTTFNAKIKVDYEGQNESQKITAYVGMQKDSVIYIQLKGLLGIVGMQVKITPDSVLIVNKIDKYVEKRSIKYISDVVQIPFDFNTLQDLLIGNAVFLNNNIVQYKQTNNLLLLLVNGNVFKHLITIDTANNCVIHSKLDDVDVMRNRTCDITYNDYQNTNNINFSMERKITVSEKTKLDVMLNYKEFAFNEPVKYSFVVPKSYKVK